MIDRVAIDRWAAAAAEGDRAALAPLFQALWPVVAAYATRLVGDPALGEDCAQDALSQLFGQLERYDRERDALTWALTLATWQCRTARRRRARRAEVSEPGADDVSLDGAAAIEHRDLVRAALAALDTLSGPDIGVITAAITGADRDIAHIAPATFRKRLERALARLRTSWRSRHGTL